MNRKTTLISAGILVTYICLLTAVCHLTACGTEPPLPFSEQYAEGGKNIGTLTVLSGSVTGTLHGEPIDEEATDISGSSNNPGTRDHIELFFVREERTFMSRLSFNILMEDAIKEDFVAPPDVNAAVCSGPERDEWDLDNHTSDVIAAPTDSAEGQTQLSFSVKDNNGSDFVGKVTLIQ
jgi:hypothetical protein